MHEYSVAQALVDQVAREAHARGATAIHAVHVRIGSLSGVMPELLASAYELCREGTPCAEAALSVEAVEAEWACPSCGEVLPPGSALRCPACARPARLQKGDEIVLTRIEMEV